MKMKMKKFITNLYYRIKRNILDIAIGLIIFLYCLILGVAIWFVVMEWSHRANPCKECYYNINKNIDNEEVRTWAGCNSLISTKLFK